MHFCRGKIELSLVYGKDFMLVSYEFEIKASYLGTNPQGFQQRVNYRSQTILKLLGYLVNISPRKVLSKIDNIMMFINYVPDFQAL